MNRAIFPPRPKGKINPSDLPHYEALGSWCAQRKFNGSRNLIHIDANKNLTVWGRYGEAHKKFVITSAFKIEILDSLELKPNTEYWLDSEVMNKQVNAKNEIILYDILQEGKYFFQTKTQVERLELLNCICGNPKTSNGIALKISKNLWMAETYYDSFVARFKETLTNPVLEGLVLRKKDSKLDHFGNVYYETNNIIRCRKPFAKDKGYNL